MGAGVAVGVVEVSVVVMVVMVGVVVDDVLEVCGVEESRLDVVGACVVVASDTASTQ